MGIEHDVVRSLARKITAEIVNSVVTDLQKMTDTLLLGDDTGLESNWDEICVQVQGEESEFFEPYLSVIDDSITDHVARLEEHERVALWLRTDSGFDWACDASENDKPPVIVEDVVADIRSGVISEAADFENEQIYNYRWGLSPGEDEEEYADVDQDSDCEDDGIENEPIEKPATIADVSKEDGGWSEFAEKFDAREAMVQLAEDFGPSFVEMIRAVAAHSAAEVARKITADAVTRQANCDKTPIDEAQPPKSRDIFSVEILSEADKSAKAKEAALNERASRSPLYKYVDLRRAKEEAQIYHNPPKYCDCCRDSLSHEIFFVDGALNEPSNGWSIMCESCFMTQGRGIRWGSGQLYMRQTSGEWLCVGGFR